MAIHRTGTLRLPSTGSSFTLAPVPPPSTNHARERDSNHSKNHCTKKVEESERESGRGIKSLRRRLPGVLRRNGLGAPSKEENQRCVRVTSGVDTHASNERCRFSRRVRAVFDEAVTDKTTIPSSLKELGASFLGGGVVWRVVRGATYIAREVMLRGARTRKVRSRRALLVLISTSAMCVDYSCARATASSSLRWCQERLELVLPSPSSLPCRAYLPSPPAAEQGPHSTSFSVLVSQALT
ncbi:hypothetical protein B0H13DRAFT_2667249 [Mycena leptocephala]|nr:hypothetical protein B0H13DRAFT_2667249 [Mycena leptocephala]